MVASFGAMHIYVDDLLDALDHFDEQFPAGFALISADVVVLDDVGPFCPFDAIDAHFWKTSDGCNFLLRTVLPISMFLLVWFPMISHLSMLNVAEPLRMLLSIF